MTEKTIITKDSNDQQINQNNNSVTSTMAHLIWLIAMIIVVLLGIRFFFVLFGANPANGFVNFIYSVSYPFARPFFGIFAYKIHYGVARVEVASLIAIVIYMLAAFIIARLLTLNHNQSTV